MNRWSAMLGIAEILCSCGLAIADCDIRNFDQTPPAAIASEVDNHFAKFQWASDADRLHGSQPWLWHYIWNKSPDTGIGVKWEKAGIKVPTTRPLPAGENFCNRKPVAAFRQEPDTEAPIIYQPVIYGISSRRQDAAVFVEHKNASLNTGGIFDTAYIDEQGKKVDVHIGVFSQRTDSGYNLQLETVPDLTVAISTLSDKLSSSELVSFLASVASQSVQVRLETLGAGGRELVGLNELFSPPELIDHLKRDYLFFRGARKALFTVETPAVEKINADIIVLDDAAHVVFISTIDILAPQR